MSDEIVTFKEDIEIDLSTSVIGWDYQLAVGKQTNNVIPSVPCSGCGKDHSKDKFIVLTINTPDYHQYRLVIPENSPMWSNIMNSQLSEEARTCLAQLEVSDL